MYYNFFWIVRNEGQLSGAVENLEIVTLKIKLYKSMAWEYIYRMFWLLLDAYIWVSIYLFCVSEKVFVGASGLKGCKANSRCIEMTKDADEKRAHWKLVC